VLASVYALRMYIRSMHNRTGAAVTSFEMSLRDGLVLVPLVLAVVAFALYPQGALTHSEPAVKAANAQLTQAGAASSARAEVPRP
jgi:NADH-quinone oxidoreductase subunit M